MTLKELRQFISDSPNKDSFVKVKVELKFPKTGIDREFQGVSAFYEYLQNQENGLKSLEGALPQDLKDSYAYFKDVKRRIIDFVKGYYQANERETNSGWNQLIINHIKKPNFSIFEFDAPNTNFLLEIYNRKGHYYNGALAYLTSSISSGSLQDRSYLNGMLLGYEYFLKGETEIEKRRLKEKSSLSRFRNHIDKYISEAEKDFVEHSSELSQKSSDTINKVEAYKTLKAEEYEKWFSKTSTGFSAFDENSKKKIQDLEELYREKLKLEAPAQYWSQRASSLRKEGYWWIGSLLFTIIIAVVVFVYALELLSDGVLSKIFEDTASAIKWSVIFITLISFLAFIIKTLSKMTFSTFHLVRDSEEREQLTYVFLSMQKEKAIDPTERHLIMQSLFSRADTGLLKDEGSPTMPGNIFDKMIAEK